MFFIFQIDLFLFLLPILYILIINPQITIKQLFILQGFTKKSFKEILKNTLTIFILLFFLSFLISFISNLFNISDLHLVTDFFSQIPFYLIIYFFIVRVFLEEWFFRAFLVKKIGCLFSSIFFAIVHAGYGSIIEVIGAFALGFVLAVYYKKTNHILPVYFAHLIYNFLAFVFILF